MCYGVGSFWNTLLLLLTQGVQKDRCMAMVPWAFIVTRVMVAYE